MTNLASDKEVLEQIQGKELVTSTGDTGPDAYASLLWPNTLTVDLQVTRKIECLRLLLWSDPDLKVRKTEGLSAHYHFRLLYSNDLNNWKLIYNTDEEARGGWHVFHLRPAGKMRYIRIHGLYSNVKNGFRILKLEAYDSNPPKLTAGTVKEYIKSLNDLQTEAGDGFPLGKKVRDIISQLEHLPDKYESINPKPIRDIISRMKTQLRDINQVEQNMDSIKREIIEPIKRDLSEASKLGKFSKYGYIVGIIGAILAIIAIIIDLIKTT